MRAPQLDGMAEVLLTDARERPVRGPQAHPEENALSPKNLLGVLWRRMWVVVLVAVALAGSAVGFSLLQTPMYEASVKILIGQKNTDQTYSNLGSDVTGLQALTATMATAVPTRPVAQDVIERLNLPDEYYGEFFENLSVQQIPETQFIELRYRDPDPERAQLVANTIGEVFSERVSKVSPSANSITATVWEEAVLPEVPVSPDPLRNGLVALVLGLLLGVGFALLLEYLDDTWRSWEEVERVSGVPTFGAIPRFAVSASPPTVRQKKKAPKQPPKQVEGEEA